MKTHITLVSANAKVGPIPVTTTAGQSCPDACPLKTTNAGGCYAGSGPLAIHWKAVTNGSRGLDYADFLASIANLPDGQLWRHNQAGDLYGQNDTIDADALGALAIVNAGKRGFTYTHKPVIGSDQTAVNNRKAVADANAAGFTVNLSANDTGHADQLAALDIGPVVTIMPIDAPALSQTPEGRRVVICPAQTRDDVTCATCKLCARADRSTIIGFRAHGTGAKKAEKVFYMKLAA